MITKFKIFERNWTEEEIKPVLLIEKLESIFKSLDYEIKYKNTEGVTYLIKEDESFYMKGGLGSNKIDFVILDSNPDGGYGSGFFNTLIEYFKTIKGIRLVNFGLQFEIHLENIDDIIKEISKESLELFITTKKYNI